MPGDELVSFRRAFDALGHESGRGTSYEGEVELARIVGSVGRTGDFDARFRLRNPALAERRRELSRSWDRRGLTSALQLFRLGEMFFVIDGHHRVSIARERDLTSLPARVRWLCTTAYGMACLRTRDLASKAAERRFLRRVPLDDDVRRLLWLDDPAQWMRLADAAESWALRTQPADVAADRRRLADAWWEREVTPLVRRLRQAGAGEGWRDVQLYAHALAVRDRRGTDLWGADEP